MRRRMITSRRHPLFFFSDLPPALQHKPHTTRNPGGSRIAVLRTTIAGSRTAGLGHAVLGFCAAHDKSEPAREDASPPTVVQRHTIILGRRRIPVPRSNPERRRPARVPEPTPHAAGYGQLPHRFAKSTTLSSHHDIHITSPHHYILHRTHRPTRRA